MPHRHRQPRLGHGGLPPPGGASPRVAEDAAAIGGAEPRHAAGRGRVRARRCRAWSSTGSTRRCASGSRPDRPTHGHLRRPPAPLRDQRGEPRRSKGWASSRPSLARYPHGVRVPQFGWNKVEAGDESLLLESGYAYFANSYRALEAPGWRVATAEHGGTFVAAVERGNVIGCQFHPELSGAYGAALLSRFLELGRC